MDARCKPGVVLCGAGHTGAGVNGSPAMRVTRLRLADMRRFAEAFGKPIVIYVKAEGYLTPEGVKDLVDSGAVAREDRTDAAGRFRMEKAHRDGEVDVGVVEGAHRLRVGGKGVDRHRSRIQGLRLPAD